MPHYVWAWPGKNLFRHPWIVHTHVQNNTRATVVLILVGINVFLALFWAYVRQPDNHIGWATLMPFASIYSTNPRTNPWNSHEKILRIGGVEKLNFFWVGHFDFFFFISMKSVKDHRLAWTGLNFDDYSGFQLKIPHAN